MAQTHVTPDRDFDAPLSDEALVREFLRGDLVAYEALVARYSRPLFNFAYRFVGDYDDANDIAQAVLVQAYTHLHRLRDDQPVRPWLFHVARNKAIDVLRARRQLRFSDLTVDDDDLSPVDHVADDQPLPEALLEHADLQRVLGEAIRRLPPKYRQVVALRYTSDLTFREMGEALNLPENTVKTLFQRAKTRLRELLVDQL
ncbi:MAG: sigma-70 family RNA polymerase sigma factor [Dehalococcoidia bacterium]|nr:sigma-70 family RNA polymerase sigma factor [Dehalococcoidia bacterium]